MHLFRPLLRYRGPYLRIGVNVGRLARFTPITASPITPNRISRRKFRVAQKGGVKFGGNGAFMLNLFDSGSSILRALQR